MPVLDGFDLTRRVKATPRFVKLPIVILSSLSAPEERRRGVDAGADAYLVKGELEAESLAATLERLMRGRRVSAATTRPIRVLVADDSALFRELLAGVVADAPGFEVVAVAADGNAAAALARRHRPDVITMDLNMPDADGFSGIARIMAETPTPILVLTANPAEAVGFRALSLGALDILEKPQADDRSRGLRPAAPLAAPAARRREGDPPPARPPRERRAAAAPRRARRPGRHRRVARRPARARRRCSAGSPRRSRRRSPSSSTSPTGSPRGSRAGSPPRRGSTCARRSDGEPLAPGRMVLAPSGQPPPRRRRGRCGSPTRRPSGTFKPSVTPLFLSAARALRRARLRRHPHGHGARRRGGAAAIRAAGGPTLAQDEATSAVFGMPRAAIELGAVDRVLPLEDIPRALVELTR